MLFLSNQTMSHLEEVGSRILNPSAFSHNMLFLSNQTMSHLKEVGSRIWNPSAINS